MPKYLSKEEHLALLRTPLGKTTIYLCEKGSMHTIATGYERVVVDKRGPYLEFLTQDLDVNYFIMPGNQLWRLTLQWKDKVSHLVYRSPAPFYTTMYLQRKTVSCADYKVGRFYISPWDLVDLSGAPLVSGDKPSYHL